MITKMGDRWNWNPTPPLNQENLDLFNFAQRSLSSICLITTRFPSRFINFRTCFSQLTVIFQQFRDNLSFSANWRQYLISWGQRGGKKARRFLRWFGGQEARGRGDWGQEVTSRLSATSHLFRKDIVLMMHMKTWVGQTTGTTGRSTFVQH